jgi:sec-independent protein translocase protein TatB
MDLFGVGTNELIVVLLLAAVVLGPERLARTARDLGKFVRDAKAYMGSFSDELKNELNVLDEIKKVGDDLNSLNKK